MARVAPDRTGQRFGRLLLRRRLGGTLYEAVCDCGTVKTVRYGDLTVSQGTRSCGCWIREVTSKRSTTHGATRGGKESPEFSSWHAMVQRVNGTVTLKTKERYEGVGMVESWREFSKFLSDMGARPAGTSLDRIDNSKGYGPDNCRWATATQQTANRRPKRSRAECDQAICEYLKRHPEDKDKAA